MLSIDFILVILALIGNLLLGLFTYFKNSRSNTNRFFFIFSIFLALYVLINYVSLHQSSNELTHFWVNILMVVIGFSNVTFFLLIHTFPHISFTLNKKVFLVSLIFTVLLIPASQMNLIFSSIEQTANGTISTPGPAMPGFFAHVVIYLGGAFYLLVKKYLQSTGNEKKQILLLLIGASVMYGLTILTNFIAVLLFNVTSLIGLLPLYSLFFTGSVSYAIVKHKFLDINLLVLRAVTYAFVIILIALFYLVSIFVAGNYLLNFNLSIHQQLFLIGITFVVAMSFPKIQRAVEISTTRIFFKNRYNTDDEISLLTKIMASTFNLAELGQSVIERIHKSIHFTQVFLIVFSKDEKIEFTNKTITLDFSEVSVIKKISELTSYDTLEEGDLKQIMRKHELQIVAPLHTKHETIGLILFGPKQSGDSYTEQDIQFLSILSDSLAVAVENARSYEEIKKFNERLQQEVEVATKELRDANQQLKELDNLKDEFVSLASHELRTPMAAIKGSLSTILEGYAGPISNDSKEFLSAAYNENDRLIRLVNNLLNTSRIESGRLSFTISPVDLAALIQDVVKNMQMQVKEKNIFLRHESIGSIPLVRADEDKIKEVVINLIGNAVKFTSQGGITIKTEVQDDMVLTSVSDTGTGIHKEDFDLLFKKFSQVKRDQKYTKSYGGTGLGLYLSQKIVEGLGGKIWLDSEVGKGTTFFFTLPIVK